MMRNNHWKYILPLLLLSSCIKPYTPKLDDNAVAKYVVQGMVSSVEGYQSATVSQTSSTDLAIYQPISGCELTISDDQGNTFQLEEYDEGAYRVWMNQTELVPGRSYMLTVKTPKGEILSSDFDEMPPGPDELESLYWEVTSIQTDDPDYIRYGVQFYTDFEAGQEDGEFYRWKCTETYEYHSEYPLEFYYSYNGVNQVSPPDSSKMVCYRTAVDEGIFTLSTLNLASPSFQKFPLNFVQNTTKRLEIMYSLIVEQQALSLEAFNYWDKLKINLDQSGGLYTSQPIAIKGNITNTSNTDNEVLGFFQASTVASKRIFIEAPIAGLELDYLSTCNLNNLRFGFIEISTSEYPAYLFSSGGNWTYTTMTKNCVDCTVEGGVTEKPSFWPN